MPKPILPPRSPNKRLLYLIKQNSKSEERLVTLRNNITSSSNPISSTVEGSFVESLSKAGESLLKGDITLSEGIGIELTQASQDINIALNASLGDLIDVELDSPSPGDGDVLTYDAIYNKWITQASASGGVSGSGTDTQVARWNGTDAIEGSAWTINDAGLLQGNDGVNVSIFLDGTPGTITMTPDSATDAVLTAKADADSQSRFRVDASGKQSWGDGSSTFDTELQRLSANVLGLASGDSFRIGNYGELVEASAPSTPSSGFTRLYADSSERVNALDDLGNSRSLAGLIYRQTVVSGSDTIANTTAKTAFASTWSMPANSMKAGKVMRVRAWGEINTHASNAPRLVFYLTWNDAGGDVDLFTSNMVFPSASMTDGTWFLDIEIICATTDSLRVGGGGYFYDALTQAGTPLCQTTPGTITADTDTATTVKMMIQTFVNASNDNNVTLQGFNIELM